jgi:hypothetical protein
MFKGYSSDDRSGIVLAVIIESAAIYSATILALLVSYVANSNIQYMFLDMVRFTLLAASSTTHRRIIQTPPVIGISFTMIILRVSLGISTGDVRSEPAMISMSMSPTAEHPIVINREVSTIVAISAPPRRHTPDLTMVKGEAY